MEEFVRLSELKARERGLIQKIDGDDNFRKRIAELGFVTGIIVKSVRKAPFEDPGAYLVKGTQISLRNSESSRIYLSLRSDQDKHEGLPSYQNSNGAKDSKKLPSSDRTEITVALVGNPNCGKTSVFNFASNSREKVANYSGVTVTMHEATVNFKGYRFRLIDLPGTYSLSALSPEEEYVRDYLIRESPEIVVNVVDATSLERNLYLTTQLIDMNINVILALNMYDEFRNKRDYLKYNKLAGMLGIPIVPTEAKKGVGIDKLFEKIIDVIGQRDKTLRQVDIPFSAEIEQAIMILGERLDDLYESDEIPAYLRRYYAIRLLEGDYGLLDKIGTDDKKKELIQETSHRIEHIDSLFIESTSNLITEERYGFIEGALRETLITSGQKRNDISHRLDNLLTHNILSLPLFFGIIFLVFYLTFSIGGYPVSWLGNLFDLVNVGIGKMMPAGMLRDLIVQGVIPGVGAVAVFLPNIIILFLFISFMEDSGYMARTAFIIDKIMHKAGLHGKSFIPLLIGFGCNVPAIMATRTIEDKRNRLLTMMIIPFMSCSARLPIYVLFISAFFPVWKPLVLFSLYMTGIIMAWVTAILFGKLLFKKAETPFVMELPPYRLPTPKAIFQHMLFKTYYFIKKMGGVILLASVVIWALGYFPAGNDSIEKNTTKVSLNASEVTSENEAATVNEVSTVNKVSHRIETSYIGKLGKLIQPVFQPLGFDWKMSISVLTGLPAKEIIISTIGVLYHSESGSGGKNMVMALRETETWKDRPMLRAFSYMVFILLYFPCIGTLTVMRKESGSILWPMIILGYTTLVAWVTSFLIFQLGSLLF